MTRGPSAFRSALRFLARDWAVEAFVLVMAAHVVVYEVPLVDSATLDWLGSTAFLIPYVFLATTAAFEGLRALPDRTERRFWAWIGGGCAAWLVTLIAVSGVRLDRWTPTQDVASDTAYVFFYVPILMAIELRPHVVDLGSRFTLERNLRWMGMAAFTLGWFAYFVLVPILVDPAFYDTTLPSTLFFITLDAVMLARFGALARAAGPTRWRLLYAALAVSSLALLVCDSLDASIAAGVLHLPNGRLTDLLWTIAPASLLVTFRLSRAPLSPGSQITTASLGLLRSLDPVRVGSLLVAGAFTFPAGHLFLHVAPGYQHRMEDALHVVALAAMSVLGALAIVAYRRLEAQRAGHERDRAALEDRLRQAQKLEAVGRVTGAVSHELDHVLKSVTVLVGRAADELGPSHPLAGELARAQGAARQAATFAQDLLVVSRRQPTTARPLDLNAALRAAESAVRAAAGPGVAVDIELASNAGWVLMGGDAFRTVLATLVKNARDAMPHGGTILLETGRVVMEPDRAFAQALRPGCYGRLLVADTGTGIPSHVMTHLFEPFFTTKGRSGGSGLGLAMAYSLVVQHGGHIGVRSEPGHGAEFEVLLPAADPPVPRVSAREPS